MKRFLVVLVLVGVSVVGLSFYLGWWTLTSDSADGKGHITVTVDKDKVQADKKKALEEMKTLEYKVKDKVAAPTDTSKDQPAPPVQPAENQ
jgi:hypothetical protein